MYDGLPRQPTASADGLSRRWDVASGLPCGPKLRHMAVCTSVEFRPDGLQLATGSFDHNVRLWNIPPLPMKIDIASAHQRTEAVIGARVNERGQIQPMSWQQWRQLRGQVQLQKSE